MNETPVSKSTIDVLWRDAFTTAREAWNLPRDAAASYAEQAVAPLRRLLADPRNYIARYAEPLPGGRAIMRVDVVFDGQLILSHTEGSPAPYATVKAHESKITLEGAAELASMYREDRPDAKTGCPACGRPTFYDTGDMFHRHVNDQTPDCETQARIDGSGDVDDPNPFCTNRSTAGDACGACAGCIAEQARIRAVIGGDR